MNFRSIFIGLAALSMALVGAYFSIQGLTALFAGAGVTITIMAAVMEFSKLVTASFLYLYWKRIATTMKIYLTTAVTVLVFITSIGIYGFLTSAFETSNQELDLINRRVEVLENKKNSFEERLESAQRQAEQLDETISTLIEQGPTRVQYESEEGNVITTPTSAERNRHDERLNDAEDRRNDLTNRIDAYTDSVMTIDQRIFDRESTADVAREIGPLKFIAEIADIPIETVVNVLALLITFSFDPLAISLVVAFNMSVYYNKTEESEQAVVTANPTPQNENLDAQTEESGSSADLETIFNEIGEYMEQGLAPPAYEVGVDIPESGSADETDESTEVEKKDEEETSPEVESDPKPPVTNKKKHINYQTPQYAPVEINGTVVGYDTDGDGLVDKWVTASWRNRYKNSTPYYAKSDYDWQNDERWKSDQAAVNYWITNIKNKSSRYPDNFDSKTY